MDIESAEMISDRTADSTGAATSLPNPGLNEVIVVWLAWAALTVLLFVTYARIPPAELYNVSHSGLAGSASRALVLLNFPIALVAIAIAGILVAHLRQAGTAAPRRWRRAVTAGIVAGVALCAIVAGPGVVSQDNLDARWINAPAALGVLILAGMTIVVARACGRGQFSRFAPSDQNRIALAFLLALVALPWLFAETGVYIGRIPVIGAVFFSEQIASGVTEVAVHLGHHHGADGFYLAITALFLSRALPGINQGKLRTALGFYLALMLAASATWRTTPGPSKSGSAVGPRAPPPTCWFRR
jgi:hypothetical protein